MLPLTLIRSQPDVVRETLRRRREDERLVDEVLTVDARRRAIVDERDNLRAEQNQASKGIGRSGKPSEADLQRLREMRERIRQLDEEATAVEADLDRLVLALPNLVDASVPDGEARPSPSSRNARSTASMQSRTGSRRRTSLRPISSVSIGILARRRRN